MYLIMESGEGKYRRWKIDKDKTTVGRDKSCDIAIDDPKVSRMHGEFTYSGGSLIYIDLNSTNGSFINGSPVKRSIISPDDHIRFGNTAFIVKDTDFEAEIVFEDTPAQVNYEVRYENLFNDLSKFAGKTGGIKETKIINIEKDTFNKAENLLINLKIIYDFSRNIFSISDKKEILKFLKTVIFSIFPEAENFYLFLGDSEEKCSAPEMIIARENTMVDSKVKISKTVFKKALTEKISILATDLKRDKRFEESASALNINIRSVMVAPMFYREKLIGALYLDNRSKPNVFKSGDPQLLSAIASMLAIAFENAREREDLQNSYHKLLVRIVSFSEKEIFSKEDFTSKLIHYSAGTAQSINLTAEQTEMLIYAAELFNIGIIPAEFYASDYENSGNLGSLSEHEKSNLAAERFLTKTSALDYIRNILACVSENYDGSGKVKRLRGNEIPLESRILKAVSVFVKEAFFSERKRAFAEIEVLEKLESNSGTKYDPQVLNGLRIFILNKQSSSSEETKDELP